MIGKHWEHFSHEADICVRGIGNSKEEAFEQAAIALNAVMRDPESVNYHLEPLSKAKLATGPS